MRIREAFVQDIDQMQGIRLSVTENTLSRPDPVTTEQYRNMITTRGKGWVCEWDDRVVGFAVVDLKEHNVWALFVDPDYENRGIGKKLQKHMLDWYFSKTTIPIWLGTDPETRAEGFYRKNGWKEMERLPNGEIKFIITREVWEQKASSPLG